LKKHGHGRGNAEAALLLIDAHEGVQENSRRHGYLLNLLGIRQIAVLVNKMDLEDYSQARFDQIEKEYRDYLRRLACEPKISFPSPPSTATTSRAQPEHCRRYRDTPSQSDRKRACELVFEVHLVHQHGNLADAQQVEQIAVAAGVFLHAFVGVDEQQSRLGIGPRP